jgi:sugar lactone lactonase YvrE
VALSLALSSSLSVLFVAGSSGCVPAAEEASPAAGSGGAGGSSASGGAPGTGGELGGGSGGASAPPDTGGSNGDGTGGTAPMPPVSMTGGTSGADAQAPADASAAGKPDRASMQPSGPGKIVLIAGGGNGGDGTPAVMAATDRPFGAVTNPLNGDVYIAEYGGHKVRRIDDKGIITTVMGAGAAGPGGKITLGQPHSLLFQPNSHTLFVADTFAGRVIKMDTTTGESEVFASGLGRVFCLAFDNTGEHLYANTDGTTVFDVKTKTTRKIATGTNRVIAVDSKNNLYLGGAGSLRVVNPAGMISDVMGSNGLAAPKHLAVDLDDNPIITDTESDTIRKYVVATKTVVKIAGGGSGALDGTPDQAKLARPHGAYVDAQGRIFIADSFNNRVLRIDY